MERISHSGNRDLENCKTHFAMYINPAFIPKPTINIALDEETNLLMMTTTVKLIKNMVDQLTMSL